MLFPKNTPPFKIELFNPGFLFECFIFKKDFFKKILVFKMSLKMSIK